ncbi:MAG: ATP-binding protein [Bacteriovorax sp.]
MSETDELMSEFLAEANEILEKVEKSLDEVLSAEDRKPELDSICRGIHTIKGASSMFDFSNTAGLAHELENKLNDYKIDPGLLDESIINDIRNEVSKISTLINAQDKIHVEPVVQDVVEIKSSTLIAPVSVPAQAAAANTSASNLDEFARIPVARIDETLRGVAEIFLIRNQMVYLIEQLRAKQIEQKDFLQAIDLIDSSMRREISELERSAMSMRMMTVKNLFSKMSRIISAYNVDSSKEIQFVTSGDDTELDKKVLDALGEPLVHLIRNAMDHGVESKRDRQLARKPEKGTIRLSARTSGNEAIIEITDDGKGIDAQKVLESAKKKGLDTTHVTDDKSAIDLIFLPGFSTAEVVSDISGRGVGMDAVKTSVLKLGGQIQIQTKLGVGSTFTIRLPVSMSLVPIVLVNINGYQYAVPNQEILETKTLRFDDLKSNMGKKYVEYRKVYIECLDLRTKISTKSAKHEESAKDCSVIIFDLKGSARAARISSFEKTTEVVVKPAPHIWPTLPWVTGVSVLATGETIFVLSLKTIFESLNSDEENKNVG